jgi:hypothetical protein
MSDAFREMDELLKMEDLLGRREEKLAPPQRGDYGRKPGEPVYFEGPDHVLYMHTCDLSCDDGQCLACGVLRCYQNEPRHFHPDGCPQCQWVSSTVRPHLPGHRDTY